MAQRGSLQVWFDPGMQWLSTPTGKRGRQPAISNVAIQACLTLKGVFKLPLRQTTGMV
ncbi:transposase, partial [Novosphingobium sp. MBES04]|uniref:transposase n=1 Tax=Novosphingobium sp. MBES04 TaxID=1206458 RepID=UPI001F572447